eukprot:3844365-Amphidinium_carterae.1
MARTGIKRLSPKVINKEARKGGNTEHRRQTNCWKTQPKKIRDTTNVPWCTPMSNEEVNECVPKNRRTESMTQSEQINSEIEK